MKNTSLITLPKATITKVENKPSRKSSFSLKDLRRFQEVYDEQQRIINDLMLENVELRKELITVTRNQKAIEETITEKKPKETKEKRIEPIPYDKLKELSGNLYEIFMAHVGRVKYRDALVHMLYTLYHLKGEATPEQLFAAADLVEVTGFRYAAFLKKARFVTYSPTNKKGYYIITDLGKQFMRGELKTQEAFCEAIGIASIKLWS
jgi:predicted transcriptional regulator